MIHSILNEIHDSTLIHIFLILIALDIIFGILRSIKNKKINSTIGIDGMLRKFGMIVAVVGMFIVNIMLNINLIAFVPEDIIAALNLPEVGIGHLFAIIMGIFEMLSILSNMVGLGIPMPKWLYSSLEQFLKVLTDEKK